MPKTIDKQKLEALLRINTKAEIAEQFGITAKSVTRLINQYGLPNPPYTQSEETKRLRVEAIQAARLRDPNLTERQIRGLRTHHQLIKGKRLEDVYPPERAAEMRQKAREALRRKPLIRKPREGPKLCSLCGTPVEAGKGKKTQSYCKACMSDYFKNYYRQRKDHYKQLTNANRRQRQVFWRWYLVELKSQPCKDCGQSYSAYCMDFDHLDSEEKVATIPELIASNASPQRILAEIAKTEVVCANCHRRREHLRYLQSNKEPVHLSPRQQRNKELIEQLKSKPCKDCHGAFSSWQMDFDHVGKDKVKNVGHLAISGSTESLVEEIAKCEVVCAVCHRNRTFSRKKTVSDTPETGFTG